jgi:hypothetical protein
MGSPYQALSRNSNSPEISTARVTSDLAPNKIGQTVIAPVILSEASDSRRESAAQSKDPFRASGARGSKRSFYQRVHNRGRAALQRRVKILMWGQPPRLSSGPAVSGRSAAPYCGCPVSRVFGETRDSTAAHSEGFEPPKNLPRAPKRAFDNSPARSLTNPFCASAQG